MNWERLLSKRPTDTFSSKVLAASVRWQTSDLASHTISRPRFVLGDLRAGNMNDSRPLLEIT
ncbi:MAG: hypothetical protein ACF8AM_11075 [Rhodopirellula sp. JB055]|uniref:hypothetical protein n=1 Tax=Rhodopirellula sp. JB055 TaxID=3342846 RepID=UPI00370B5BE9